MKRLALIVASVITLISLVSLILIPIGAKASVQIDSTIPSASVKATYSGSGELVVYDVDYWWISNIAIDDVVLLSIIPETGAAYSSTLLYSNLTEIDDDWGTGTHIQDFVAKKNDDYLLKIHASNGDTNYTINCNYPISKQPFYSESGKLLKNQVYNYWITDVNAGDLILLNIIPETWVAYTSILSYSNLTEVKDEWGAGTHTQDFIAKKTDDYLLKIYASNEDINYTIKQSVQNVDVIDINVGWNMVSFPCLPDDPSFSSIFSEVPFYQVISWDGSGYVSSTVAEAGVGYWVLVLEETTLTIENAEPVTSYTKSLPAGWSMIGSIYDETVDADDVFPGFYQLLTWDGTSYTASSVIEPGKGYWALVLEPTTITVGG